MADEQEPVQIPDNGSSGHKFVCSHCDKEFDKYVSCMRHTQFKGSDSLCRENNATVKIVASTGVTSPEEVNSEPTPSRPDVGLGVPSASPPSDQLPSMAERAAGSRRPSWMDTLDIPALDDEEVDLPRYDVEPISITRPTGAITITPRAWLLVAYEAYQRQGFIGSMSDFVHSIIEEYFIISGIKIEMFAVPANQRNQVLQRAGLRDAT